MEFYIYIGIAVIAYFVVRAIILKTAPKNYKWTDEDGGVALMFSVFWPVAIPAALLILWGDYVHEKKYGKTRKD
jgi:hypothetical protein